MNTLNTRLTIPLMIAALTWGAAAGAQTPNAAQPGQIEKQFREPPKPRSTPQPVVEPPAQEQKAPLKADAVPFVLRQVIIEGVTVYPEAGLRSFFADLLDKEITLLHIYELANEITAKYRNDGYILSQVIVPEQKIILEQGVARLRVIEGFVDQVRLEGAVNGPPEVLQAYAERIKRSRPLRAQTLERYLLLINDLGGMVARATLAPSQSVAGASDLLIMLTQDKFSADLGVNNRNSRSLGPWRFNAGADFYSAFGRYEHSGLRAATTANQELNFIALLHDIRAGDEGGRFGVNLSYARAEPQETENLPPDLQSESVMGALSYSHPAIRSRTRNLYLRGSFTVHDGKTGFAGIKLSEDRLRALRAGITFDNADRWRGINILDAEFSQGLDILGATETGSASLSRADGHSDFRKLALYAARLQDVANAWSVLLAANGQLAFNALLGAEQFSFGGEPFGRGYDPSELVGDSGVAFKIEPRYSNALKQSFARSYTVYGYYDFGKVWRRGAQDQKKSESAAAVGLGVRLSLNQGFSGFIEIAKPTTRLVENEGDDDPRIFGGFSKRF